MRREGNFKLPHIFDMTSPPDERCLAETRFFDISHQELIRYAENKTADFGTEVERAIALYYAVRDEVLYDPYQCLLTPEQFRASQMLACGQGFCMSKALLLAALARCIGIPSLVGFADVLNHLATPKMEQLLKNDLYFHGYAALYLNGKWLKVSPAFNISMCEKFDSRPLEFDGKSDALLHEYDMKNRRHMEYLTDYGAATDLPYQSVIDELWFRFPEMMDFLRQKRNTASFSEELRALDN